MPRLRMATGHLWLQYWICVPYVSGTDPVRSNPFVIRDPYIYVKYQLHYDHRCLGASSASSHQWSWWCFMSSVAYFLENRMELFQMLSKYYQKQATLQNVICFSAIISNMQPPHTRPHCAETHLFTIHIRLGTTARHCMVDVALKKNVFVLGADNTLRNLVMLEISTNVHVCSRF